MSSYCCLSSVTCCCRLLIASFTPAPLQDCQQEVGDGARTRFSGLATDFVQQLDLPFAKKLVLELRKLGGAAGALAKPVEVQLATPRREERQTIWVFFAPGARSWRSSCGESTSAALSLRNRALS